MVNFAGTFKGGRYPSKSMTELVYPVDGGMEDWGYAASWDTKYVFLCQAGTAFGGYSAERQRERFNNASFRVFNVLVRALLCRAREAHTLAGGCGVWGGSGGGCRVSSDVAGSSLVAP
jgi:hypothetical protein